jgi:hypothetical protein
MSFTRVSRTIRILTGVLAAAAVVVSAAANGADAQERTISLVGDSLVANRTEIYKEAFSLRGVPANVDGVGSRAIRWGWQCKVDAGLRVFPRPVHAKCKREGLELLRHWERSGSLGTDVVVALGTNDAGLYPGPKSLPNLDQLRKVVGDRHLWLVTVRKLNGSKSAPAWNKTATAWCERDQACSVIEWGESQISAKRSLYIADGVHLTPRGAQVRAEFIATVVAGH